METTNVWSLALELIGAGVRIAGVCYGGRNMYVIRLNGQAVAAYHFRDYAEAYLVQFVAQDRMMGQQAEVRA